MGSRFWNSGKFFPAGVVSILSLIMAVGYIHALIRTSHDWWKIPGMKSWCPVCFPRPYSQVYLTFHSNNFSISISVSLLFVKQNSRCSFPVPIYEGCWRVCLVPICQVENASSVVYRNMDLWQCYMYTLLDSLKWNYSPAYKILSILLQVPMLCMGSSVWQGAFCAQEYLFLDRTKVDSSLLKHLENSQIWSHNVSEALHVVVLYNFTLLSEICRKLFGMKISQWNKPQQWIGLLLKQETPE